ncbi:hypothetical protein B0I37DRAFT_400838 [Chaetomium sp. MPI-CAGE-AT-0009]|nr:hypothetical protein B0I37DRAFT_400838 [Chaetomium sp. MPI-CAGE-AT-0009]
MAPPEKYVFCLPPRCAFCRFRIDDDDIIGVSEAGRVLPEKFRPGPQRGIADIVYMPCSEECRHGNAKAFGCHPECLELVPFKLRSAVIEATSYRYEPPLAEEERRARWLRWKWSTILNTTFQRRLPLELCDIIAQYSLRKFAVHRALALLKFQHSASCYVSLSTRVWVRYTIFEGVRYIQSLTNEQPPDDSSAVELVYDLNPIDTMFVAEDHLGVRNLIFASSSEKPTVEEQSNVWWRTVAIPSWDLELEGETNGAKLRSLTSLDEPRMSGFILPMYWSMPQFPKQLWCNSVSIVHDPNSIRMSAFMCNDPGVIGYSVCCARDVVAMHAHYPEEDVGEFYRRSQRFHAVWQYMPVDEGEAVVEIWRREDRYFPIHSLAFRTNKGRIAVMGAWPIRYGSWILQEQNWTLLTRMGKQPSRVFYETDYSGIGLLAFETPRLESARQCPANLAPLSAGPDSNHEVHYYTSSDLSGVTAVTPCQRQYGETPVIRGLLLHHANAHVSCVGEVRLDSLGCRLEVTGSLWLGFSTDMRGGPCVTQISTSHPAETGTVAWSSRLMYQA